MTTNPDVDRFVERAKLWPDEIAALRPILISTGLTEEIKWRQPCYTHGGKNIVILGEMKDFLAIGFFKGALLDDPRGLLTDIGPNSRSAKRICVRSVADVEDIAHVLPAYIEAAVAVETEGTKLPPAPDLELVDELATRLQADSELREAFESLTPGRQREYNIYISGAKQASTREARIDRYAPKILAGKGLRDR